MEADLCVYDLRVTIGTSGLLQWNCLNLMALNQLKGCRAVYFIRIRTLQPNGRSFACGDFVSTTTIQAI
jgi:hypothetical protein